MPPAPSGERISNCPRIVPAARPMRVAGDGEIVALDAEGRSIFADLMMGRGEPSYCAFDLVWLNGRDLRQKPLLIRKRMLRQLVPRDHPRLRYMSHLDSGGSRFFKLVREQARAASGCRDSPPPGGLASDSFPIRPRTGVLAPKNN